MNNDKICVCVCKQFFFIDELQMWKRQETKSITCVEAKNQKFHTNISSTKSYGEVQLGVDRLIVDATILFGNS